jgi:hypothetical protein
MTIIFHDSLSYKSRHHSITYLAVEDWRGIFLCSSTTVSPPLNILPKIALAVRDARRQAAVHAATAVPQQPK